VEHILPITARAIKIPRRQSPHLIRLHLLQQWVTTPPKIPHHPGLILTISEHPIQRQNSQRKPINDGKTQIVGFGAGESQGREGRVEQDWQLDANATALD
jgi:hypothetical protein